MKNNGTYIYVSDFERFVAYTSGEHCWRDNFVGTPKFTRTDQEHIGTYFFVRFSHKMKIHIKYNQHTCARSVSSSSCDGNNSK